MSETVYLFDVDNTLLDNDRVTRDLKSFLDREVGSERSESYWRLFEEMRSQLGYADYLGALQRYRVEHPYDSRLLTISTYLINYPFANRLFPNSLDVIEACRKKGKVVILTDGDVVFQPRKIERSGLFEAVDGNILIYIHKEHELADVERATPPTATYSSTTSFASSLRSRGPGAIASRPFSPAKATTLSTLKPSPNTRPPTSPSTASAICSTSRFRPSHLL